MKKVKTSMLLLLVFGYISLFSQSTKDKFTPNARITLLNDSVIELSDFQLHSKHYLPNTYFDRNSSYKMDIPLKNNNLWRLIPFIDIVKITFYSNKISKKWLNSKILLESGEILTGEIPIKPKLMWKKGSDFKINGKVKVLGTLGEYKISLKNVKEIARDINTTDVYTLTTIENEKKRLINPTLKWYSYGRDWEFTDWSRGFKIDFRTGDLTVDIRMGDIDSLVFPQEGNLIIIKMKEGSEATGTFQSSISYMKGMTKSGLIWYQALRNKNSGYNIKSIKFL